MAMHSPELIFDRVWKRFRRGNNHDSLRDFVPSLTRRLLGRHNQQAPSREFWAIRDLSFEVKPGEILGIIGPNGAGKSTTLKLLNRIMEPTAGVVSSTGRIGALIEVSAGFHQDLTGRQNVFLQGAIMGMRKSEIERKFDEIVDFSGIADFIDTPVKRYSSGMNARLGFSIAAHLEPEILIIDEVLAVGDQFFQQRAFGRIKQMATAGAPVVLVSHQLDRIAELCTKAILMDRGAIRTSGTPSHCINEYLHGMSSQAQVGIYGDVGIHFHELESTSGLAIPSGAELRVIVRGTANCLEPRASWFPTFRVVSVTTGEHVHAVIGNGRGVPLPVDGDFEYEITLQMNLPPGQYNLQPLIWETEGGGDVVAGRALQVEVLDRSPFWGSVQLNTEWRVVRSGNSLVPASSVQRAR
jgi:ABC-type polysaccharide/polyol phosphate transport system ATPase subunit